MDDREEGLKMHFDLEATYLQDLAPVEHSFTRFRARLYPCLFSLEQQRPYPGASWVSLNEVGKLAFSSGHRRILGQVLALL